MRDRKAAINAFSGLLGDLSFYYSVTGDKARSESLKKLAKKTKAKKTKAKKTKKGSRNG